MVDSVPMCRVLYRCELFDEDTSYPKEEMESRIEAFLMAQLQECPMEAAALTIKTLNKNPEKIQTCVETIKKIIQVSITVTVRNFVSRKRFVCLLETLRFVVVCVLELSIRYGCELDSE